MMKNNKFKLTRKKLLQKLLKILNGKNKRDYKSYTQRKVNKKNNLLKRAKKIKRENKKTNKKKHLNLKFH